MLRKLVSFRGVAGLFLGVILAGCGAGYAPSASSPSLESAIARGALSHEGSQRMRALSSGQDLLYVVNQTEQSVNVYTYPQGQLVGTLTGFVYPQGECADSAGDVFIVSLQSMTSNSSVISEYAHGGTSRIAMLSDPSEAAGCAVDQESGNLAACGGYLSGGNEYGDVAIYSQAQGSPKVHYSTTFAPFELCGYDPKGDLYITADSSKYADEFQLVRLAKDSTKFMGISLKKPLIGSGSDPSSVQWDGKHMTVSSYSDLHRRAGKKSYIYRLRFSGTSATVVGTTTLRTHHRMRLGQVLIYDGNVVGSDVTQVGWGLDVWSYPQAHKAQSIVPGMRNFAPIGIALSHASS